MLIWIVSDTISEKGEDDYFFLFLHVNFLMK